MRPLPFPAPPRAAGLMVAALAALALGTAAGPAFTADRPDVLKRTLQRTAPIDVPGAREAVRRDLLPYLGPGGGAPKPVPEQVPLADIPPELLLPWRLPSRWMEQEPLLIDDPDLPGGPLDPIPACTDGAPAPRLNRLGTILGGQPFFGTMGFEAMTGVPVGAWHAFVGMRQGWAPLRGTAPGGRLAESAAALARYPCMRVVLSYPGFPRGQGHLAACAEGRYREHHQSYGRAIARHGLGDQGLILRLGWEWNADTTAMSANHDLARAPLFAACFRATVTGIRRGCGPGCSLLFDYNSAASIRRDAPMLEQGYPGDGYVDIVSVEGYDGHGHGSPEDRWRAQAEILDYVRDFGRARGKHMAIPEWGIIRGPGLTGNGGGDNPYHVRKICEYAKDPDNAVYYLVYFNGSAELPWHDLRDNPRAMAAFREHCRPVAATTAEARSSYRP